MARWANATGDRQLVAVPPNDGQQPLLNVVVGTLAPEEAVVALLDQLRLGPVAAQLVGVLPNVALGVATVVEVQAGSRPALTHPGLDHHRRPRVDHHRRPRGARVDQYGRPQVDHLGRPLGWISLRALGGSLCPATPDHVPGSVTCVTTRLSRMVRRRPFAPAVAIGMDPQIAAFSIVARMEPDMCTALCLAYRARRYRRSAVSESSRGFDRHCPDDLRSLLSAGDRHDPVVHVGHSTLRGIQHARFLDVPAARVSSRVA
jgi:hypothetical protein